MDVYVVQWKPASRDERRVLGIAATKGSAIYLIRRNIAEGIKLDEVVENEGGRIGYMRARCFHDRLSVSLV